MHYCQPQPRFRAAAIAPGAEQPDIESPRWSNCTVPVVFWPYWCAAARRCLLRARQTAPWYSIRQRAEHAKHGHARRHAGRLAP